MANWHLIVTAAMFSTMLTMAISSVSQSNFTCIAPFIQVGTIQSASQMTDNNKTEQMQTVKPKKKTIWD